MDQKKQKEWEDFAKGVEHWVANGIIKSYTPKNLPPRYDGLEQSVGELFQHMDGSDWGAEVKKYLAEPQAFSKWNFTSLNHLAAYTKWLSVKDAHDPRLGSIQLLWLNFSQWSAKVSNVS